MSAAWVVVADSCRARIFSAEKPTSPLVELQILTHPEGRLHQGDLVTDRPGRDRNSSNRSHDMGHECDAKDEEALRFAAEVCEVMENGRARGEFQKLYIVSAPGFLGLLRKHQSGSLKKMVSEEIAKNLCTKPPEQIRSSLPQYL
jgi:protein required for attachment to host cells